MKIVNIGLNVVFGSLSVICLSMLAFAVCTMIINVI